MKWVFATLHNSCFHIEFFFGCLMLAKLLLNVSTYHWLTFSERESHHILYFVLVYNMYSHSVPAHSVSFFRCFVFCFIYSLSPRICFLNEQSFMCVTRQTMTIFASATAKLPEKAGKKFFHIFYGRRGCDESHRLFIFSLSFLPPFLVIVRAQ